MPDNRRELRTAAQHIKAGDKKAARMILHDYLTDHPEDADGWYLAAKTTNNAQKAEQYLLRALDHNPNHAAALKALNRLEGREPVERPGRRNCLVMALYGFLLLAFSVIVVLVIVNSAASPDISALPTTAPLTSTETPAPSPQPSATLTAIPTLTPGPGALLYTEPFDAPEGWHAPESDADRAIQVVDGELVVTNYGADILGGDYNITRQFGDGIYTVDVRKIGGAENDGYGLLWHLDETRGSFYLYLVSSDGYAAAFYCDVWCDSAFEMLMNWTEAPMLNQGIGAENTIWVEAEGARYALYANDQRIGQFGDERLTTGRVGVGAYVFEAGGSAVAFDDLTVHNLP